MAGGLLIITPSRDPYFNMAMDEWLFDRVCRGIWADFAILRIYSWSVPAITIGYNQNSAKAVDWALMKLEWPIIRRVTGGRAIFHESNEITFSLTANLCLFPDSGKTLSQANSLISEAVVKALREFGVMAEWARSSDINGLPDSNSIARACFNSITKYEIISNGVKIAGGAQRRKGESLIHQGSIKLFGVSVCLPISQKPIFSGLSSGNEDNHLDLIKLKRFSAFLADALSEKMGLKFRETVLDTAQESEIIGGSVELRAHTLEKR